MNRGFGPMIGNYDNFVVLMEDFSRNFSFYYPYKYWIHNELYWFLG